MGIESINKKVDVKNIKSKEKEKKERIQLPPSKIVIRRLPPTFTEEDLKTSIDPVPENNYFCFVPADKRLGQLSFSRAYINFTNTDEIFNFRDKFDGYVFVDQKGNEFPAIVEYAPFQKIPKVNINQKKDPRCGTIDEDADYLQFLNLLENPEVVTLPQIETLLEEIENTEREIRANNGILKVKTPLLEFIEQRNANKLRPGERKRRKEIERKQAREEAKRKRKENVREWRYAKKEEVKEEKKKKDEEKSKRKEEKEKRPRKDRVEKIKFTEESNICAGEAVRKKPEKTKSEETEFIVEDEETPNLKKEAEVKSSRKPVVDSVKSKRYSEVRKREDKKGKPENVDEEKVKSKHIASKENETSKICESDEQSEKDSKYDSKKQTDEDSKASDTETKKERETRRANRIKNKDRPAMQLYRPGQSKIKSQSKGNDESTSSSSSPDMALEEEKKEEKKAKEASSYRTEKKKFSKNSYFAEDKNSTKKNYYEEDKSYPKKNFYGEERTYNKKNYSEDDKGYYPKKNYCEEDKGYSKKTYFEGEKSYPKKNYFYEEEKGFGKYKEDSGRYESSKPSTGRKGYSYHQERENKAKLKNKDQEANKSLTFRRSTSQE